MHKSLNFSQTKLLEKSWLLGHFYLRMSTMEDECLAGFAILSQIQSAHFEEDNHLHSGHYMPIHQLTLVVQPKEGLEISTTRFIPLLLLDVLKTSRPVIDNQFSID